MFTTDVVGYPGLHIPSVDGKKDFTPVIEKALELGVGMKIVFDWYQRWLKSNNRFCRNAVLGQADKVIEAVKSGSIRHFF